MSTPGVSVRAHPGLFAQRVFQDDALRLAFVWLVLIGLNTLALLGLQLWWARSVGEAVLAPRLLLALLWLGAAAYLVLGRLRRRCRTVDLSLPLSARSLWLSHLTSVALAACSAVLLALVPILLVGFLQGPRVGVFLPGELAGGVVHLLAGVLLGATILQADRPSLWRVPADTRWRILLAAVVTGLLLLTLAIGLLPVWMSAITLALAAALALRVWRSLPQTLVVAPAEPIAAEATAQELTSADERRAPGVARTIYGILYRVHPWAGMTSWVSLPFVALFGAVVAGGLEIWIESSELRFLYIPFAVYMQLATIGPVTQNFFRVDPLPVSRRKLFAIMVLPTVLALALGYAGGRLARHSSVARVSQVEYRVDGRYHWVQPPPGYLEVAWDGSVPTLESPWGETHEAWSAPVFSWGALRVYSPFNTSEEATADFEALLTSRALAAVHGLEVPPQEIRSRYFLTNQDRVVGLRDGGLALSRDFPDLALADSGPEAPLVLGGALVLYFVVLAGFLSTFRARFSDRARQTVFWAFLAMILFTLFLETGLAIADLFRPEAARILIEIGIHYLAASPLSVALVWFGSGIAAVAGYLLAQSRFARAEFSPHPTRFTLIAFGRDTDSSR